jgi:hypothetical protein
MTLRDFAVKKKEEADKHGLSSAVYTGVQEAIMKAAAVYTDKWARPVWDAEWDVCLVLDATRLDLWREVAAEFDDGGAHGRSGQRARSGC